MFAQVLDRGQRDKDTYWHSELRSLGVVPSTNTVLCENRGLGELTESFKQTMYQEYKTAYSTDNCDESFSTDKIKTLPEIAKEDSFTE